jgi:stage II sporulation protein D (peptidoglycan lytic transglycosylase)
LRSPSSSSTRRWARPALASLALAAAACPHPAPLAPGGGEPELRVGLVTGAPRATLGGDGELFVTDDGSGAPIGAIPAGVTWQVVPDSAGRGGGLRLIRPDSGPTEPHQGISAVNVTENHFAMVDGRRYRGRINVIRMGAGLTVMNRVGIEGYLAGVIGMELGPRRPDEFQALLAQAIVSRTFALRNLHRWEDLGFDAWDDTRDQVYGGVTVETPQVWAALRATTGLVSRYHGELIDAYFHSTCGFSTASVEEAFRTARSRPYLRPVSDASGRDHYYCDISPRFRWREEWDAATLRAILTRTLAGQVPIGGDGLPPVTDVAITRTSSSGRVAELRIVFPHSDVRIAEPDVRGVLRPAGADRLLQSAAFQLFVTHDGAGRVTRLVAAGAGSGHGVGLCQWGAIGRARAGRQFREILETYYPGTNVEKLY